MDSIRPAPARVLARRRMLFAAGPDHARDRPGHVRAASGCCLVRIPGRGRRLAVVQDDARFVALVDPDTGRAEPLALPTGPGGRRRFDDALGNKRNKPDLEAISAVVVDGAPALLAIGSGSAAPRELLLLIRLAPGGTTVEELPAAAFFAKLRSDRGFAGSELNIEGMVQLPNGSLRLFNRGNGAADALGPSVDATCDVPFAALLAHLRDPAARTAPAPQNVTHHDLGALGGVRLAFTDASAAGAGILFLAAAEASPNALEDGEVTGTALGLLRPDGTRVVAPLHDEAGRPLREKAEGLAVDPDEPERAFVVVDRDDPDVPADLLLVELPPWE